MADTSIEARVAVLEALQTTMAEDIHEMRVNHLPHIERKLDALILGMAGALFTALVMFARILLS